MPAFAPPDSPVEVEGAGDDEGVDDGVDVAVERVDDEDEDEDVDEDEEVDGVAVAPSVAATLTSPAFPQQSLVEPQHQVSDLELPSSHGVI